MRCIDSATMALALMVRDDPDSTDAARELARRILDISERQSTENARYSAGRQTR